MPWGVWVLILTPVLFVVVCCGWGTFVNVSRESHKTELTTTAEEIGLPFGFGSQLGLQYNDDVTTGSGGAEKVDNPNDHLNLLEESWKWTTGLGSALDQNAIAQCYKVGCTVPFTKRGHDSSAALSSYGSGDFTVYKIFVIIKY